MRSVVTPTGSWFAAIERERVLLTQKNGDGGSIEPSATLSSMILTLFCVTNQAYLMGFLFLLAGLLATKGLEKQKKRTNSRRKRLYETGFHQYAPSGSVRTVGALNLTRRESSVGRRRLPPVRSLRGRGIGRTRRYSKGSSHFPRYPE
jgi:hypothetical protein